MPTGPLPSGFSSGTHDYDTLLTETGDLVRSYLEIRDLKEWHKRNMAEERLQKAFRSKTDQVLAAITRRYLFDQEKGFNKTPLLTLLEATLPDSFRRQLYYIHYCLAEKLAYEVVTGVFLPKHDAGDSGVSRKAIDAYLTKLEPKHPEVGGWQPTIRDRITNSLLSAFKEFGILGGPTETEFQSAEWPIEIFAYVLYLIRDRKSKHWLSHKHWGMLFLREPQVMAYLRKADAEGIVIFNPTAADLEFTCSTLLELAEEFAKAQTSGKT